MICSLDSGKPFDFQLGIGQVIAGWEQGLLEMCVGEKRKLTIPPHLGYGDKPAGTTALYDIFMFHSIIQSTHFWPYICHLISDRTDLLYKLQAVIIFHSHVSPLRPMGLLSSWCLFSVYYKYM